MQNTNPVIQSAKVDALFKFAELVRRMAQDADNNIVQTLTSTGSALDQRTLSTARQFLRLDGNTLLKKLEDVFRDQVERAMRTMYTDLRTGLGNLSADTLTLIDDETVNRQMEVGRLVDRLRDACDENLGRLNIMIAQLHGDHEVHERENPFRPYLIARTLHDVLRTMVKDEEVSASLFHYLSNALAQHLPAYYAELCDVFQAAGVHAQLISRPTALKRHQRTQLAQQAQLERPNFGGNFGTGSGGSNPQQILPENINPQVLPGLQRLLELMQQNSGGTTADASQLSLDIDNQNQAAHQSAAFQDFVRNIFNQAQAGTAPSQEGAHAAAPEGGVQLNAQPPASPALLSQLNEYQQLAARGEAVSQQISPDQNQLFAVREQISGDNATKLERVAIDVVAVLFEFILEDEQIPASLRVQIGRLQIPFLKAAMLAPELLQQADHPARQLLNRMGSAAIGLDPDTLMGQNFIAEMTRIVKKILNGFDKDIAIFSDCLEEFELFLAKNLRNVDSDTTLSIAAMEEAETISVLMQSTTAALRDILRPLAVDQRVAEFILQIWTQVLVRSSLQESGKEVATDGSMSGRYRDILPELIWSAQEKHTPADRNALMRLLPTLVKRLKIGLVMIHLPEKKSQQALDQLIAVHSQILRNPEGEATQNLPTLEELRQLFSGLVIDPESAAWTTVTPPQIQSELIETALAERGVSANLELTRESLFAAVPDATWLAQIRVGTLVECFIADKFQLARLIWISQHQSLYMFKLDKTLTPKVYSSTSLSKSLHDGSVRLIETAPTFERAVESLLLGAEAMQAKRS